MSIKLLEIKKESCPAARRRIYRSGTYCGWYAGAVDWYAFSRGNRSPGRI